MARTLITQDQLDGGILTSQLADGAEFLQRDGSVALTGDLNANSNKITNVDTPTADGDAANKLYVDNKARGLDWKESVRAATTANITLSGTQTIDGVSLSVGNRVLVKDQSSPDENGIYDVAAGAWTRSIDADTNAEVTSGLTVFISEGTAAQNTVWTLTTDDPITVGATSLVFSQTGGGTAAYTAGDGLTLTGNDFDVVTADSTRIAVAANSIDLGIPTISGSGAGSNFTKVSVDVYGRVVTTGAAVPSDIGAQPVDTDLTALAGLSSTGIIVRTGSGTATVRSVATASSSRITVTNGDGVSGNPTLDLATVSIGSTGTFNKVTADTYGRVTNLEAVDATDITTALGYTPLDNADFVWNEAVAGTVNGVNTAFTVANSPIDIMLYVNGVLQKEGAGNDFTISGANITMLYAPLTGSTLTATYTK